MNPWQKISNIGINNLMSESDFRRAQLTNRLVVLAFVMSLTYIPVFITQNSLPLLLNVGSLIVAVGFLFLLIKNSKHQTAAILLSVFLITHLMFSAILVENGTGRYFLILFSILGFAMIKSPKIGIALFAYAVVGFFFAEYAHQWFEPVIKRSADNNNAVYIINMFLIFMGCFFLIFHYKQGNILYERNILAQKEEIEKQHDELSEAHKEIQDSIRYARRIQKAILPPIKLLDEYLKNYFVLYKPKDIVAGDFYWLEHIEGTTYFAAADCTGHGVPGAMVSVVCNHALNRTVKELGVTNPGKILDCTRDIVIQEFEKSEEDVKDGMDISLCSLKGNKLQFSGANNSLWIIRNGEHIVLRADKQPIGKFEMSHPYSTKEFEIEAGDTIYLFTDGYADQFGGTKGKKLKAKPFLDILIKNQDKSMPQQKEILDDFIEEWKGIYEQVDDICVLGVRF